MERVSVIIPVYNLEGYISYCLESVCRQTYQSLEILVVDDGSTDHSVEVCQSFAQKDSRIRIIQKENGGVSSARNRGLAEATGGFISFVDGDDIIAPTMIETLIANLKENSAILSKSSYQEISNYDSTWDERNRDAEVLSSKEYAEKILNGTAEIGACSAVFQKDLIGNLRFNTAIRHNEDKLFLFEYVAENEGTIICSNQKLYGYYKRVGSATKSGFSLNLLDVIRANRIIYERTEQRFPQYMQQAAFNLMVARLSVLKAIIDAGVYQENKELFRKIKGNVLRTSCKGASAKRRLERAALLIGDWLYIVCVKVYRTIRKFFGKETAEKVRKVVGKKG